MNQLRILELLKEASNLSVRKRELDPGKTLERLTQISEEFRDAVPRFEDPRIEDNRAATALQELVKHLFFDTLNSRPEHLPKLFPFFASVCSDENFYLGSGASVPIHWNLLPPSSN
ncbi:MAG: hypothetical protein ACM3TU_00460 [Bacillota bacterium]